MPPDETEEFGPPIGPDDAELPDEPPDLDELDPFEADPEEYDAVSEFISDEWKNSTTARERVRDVICRMTEPVTANEVADVADVSVPTARTKLGSLVDESYVKAESSKDGTVYQRDPDWYRMQRVCRLAEKSTATVESVLRRIENEVREYQEKYGTETPGDLIVNEADLGDEAWRDISEWRTALVDQQYIKTALQFQRLRNAEVSDSVFGISSSDTDRDDEVSTVEP